MKTALVCELIAVKKVLAQLLCIYTLLIVVGALFHSVLIMVSCISAMTPFLVLFTLFGYDATNGWERFRAALPVSRTALVVSRYANVLLASCTMAAFGLLVATTLAAIAPGLSGIVDAEATSGLLAEAADPTSIVAASVAGMCIVLCATSVLAPFIVRFGLTKATRFAPLLLVPAVPLAVNAFSAAAHTSSLLGDAVVWLNDPANTLAAIAAAIATTLVVYALSCLASVSAYRTKEL